MTDVRGHNEGSLFLRSRDERWVAVVTMPDGTRRSATAKTKAEGVRLLGELLRRRDVNAQGSRNQRLGPYLERWAKRLTDLAPSTIRQHRMIVRVHLAPALGRRKLAELTPSDVDRYLARTDLDPRTRSHHRSTLRRALADAQRDGLVSRNVAALSRPVRVRKAERRILTVAEVRLLIESSRGERLWPLWTLIVTTGLRVSEALGLAWSEIEGDTLVVRRQLSRDAGEWSRREPKSLRSCRTISLVPLALEALRVQRERQDQERADYPQPIDGLVFTTPTGRPIHSSNLLPPFRRALAVAGLPKVTIHDMRHATATIMYGAGVPIEVIADILGHSTVRVTQDLYVHRRPEMQRDAAAKLAEALS